MPTTTRMRLTIGLAVVVVAAIVGALVLIFGGRAPATGGAAAAATSAPTSTTSAAPGAATVAPEKVGGDAPEPDGAATPVDAVRGFVGSLGAGNAEAAYRLMHPRYRDAFDSYPAFAADPAPAELFGSYGVLGAGAYQSATFEAAVATEPVAVVSMFGSVTRDGEQVTEAISLATRRAPSGWLVDAGGTGGSVFQNPGTAGEQLTDGDDLVLWTPSAGLMEVLAVVDGEPRTTSVTELDVPSETGEVRVDDYSPGVQQAAIGVLKEDGSVVTVATFFTA